MDSITVDKFLFILPLETGVIIIGWLSAISSVFAATIVASFVTFAIISIYLEDRNDLNIREWVTLQTNFIMQSIFSSSHLRFFTFHSSFVRSDVLCSC